MNNYLVETLAAQEELERPWSAFIGLITLHESRFCTRGTGFAMDTSKIKTPDVGQVVIVHPDDKPIFKEAANRMSSRQVSDAELAAILWWTVQNRRRL